MRSAEGAGAEVQHARGSSCSVGSVDDINFGLDLLQCPGSGVN